ncbi:MAG TPA: SGNH/GDSL hydrolase family protein [Solirubrobacterales bacterium]|nr:SGNH/GDSL hydrolase family protein [Solirubrobacterales bacterium]
MLRRHGILATLLGALVLLAAPAPEAVAAPAAPGMGWTVVDRYGGDANGDGRLDDETPLRPADLNAFAVRVLPSASICAELERATWRVDGEAAEPRRVEPGPDCGAVLSVAGEGEHTVKVLARNRAEVARVEVEDKLIVALGDSVASGEGNPAGKGEDRWLDEPCHRSAAAGFEQAANQLGKVDRRRSITFVSLACSGARIDKGLLESYAGIEPGPGKSSFLPQVGRLGEIDLRRRADGDGPGVDAVLLSVGANDVRFSSVVKKCALPGDCREGVKRAVEERVAALGASYDSLADELGEAAPDAPVFITEYFDPTHDELGRFCKDGPGLTTDEEVQWAYEELLRPLNRQVKEAADRNGWQRVGGIASDFKHHGYCAQERGWVRTLDEALQKGNPAGTLHPNEEGHKAIARRVAGPLAAELDFQAPAAPPEAEGEEGLPGPGEIGSGVATAVFAPQLAIVGQLLEPDLDSTWRRLLALWLLLPLLIGAVWLGLRALMLLRATWPPDPVGDRKPPQLSGRQMQISWRQLLLIGVGVAVLFAAMIVLAGLVGRAILWLRFWCAQLPADQAANAVSGSELVSTGAVALAIFIGLGLAAAAVAWLLDGNGREVRTTRRGLVAIGLVEVLAAIWIGDFRGDQGLQLLVGVVVAALLLHYLVDRALEWRKAREESGDGSKSPVEEAWIELKARVRLFFESDEPWAPRLYRLAPFLLLALALYLSTWTEGVDRALAIAAWVGAAMLFAAPGGMAAPGVRWKKLGPEELKSLTAPRIALAAVGFAIVVILLSRDELWLAGVAATAVLLGLLCLAVAAASGEWFAPYGLAVLVSVPLFAGAAAFLHGLDSPELQPVAVVLDDGEALCGAYVGERDGQLWMARVDLDERAGVHRPRRGAIAPLDADRVEAKTVGALEPVDLLEPRALELRDGLLDGRGDRDTRKRAPSCDPSPELRAAMAERDEPGAGAWQRQLAERHQPELVVDRRDGFWPVPVSTLFSFRDRRAAVCRRVTGGGEGCLRLGSPGEFPWLGGEGESLEYPAADNDVDEQHDQMVAALGSADPEASAAEYYLVDREADGEGPISIQYWFYYPFNYQPVGGGLAEGGFHEADFESVGVLLSARSQEPRYVWMNRHDKEGRAFPWDDDALSRPDGHPRVFAARGSHATYENCEGQVRPLDVKGLIDDHPTCDSVRQLHLLPEVTPLIDLSRVGWACWHGLFGHRNGGLGVYEGSNKFLIADAPKSPLWQQKFGGEEVEPCRGVEDPGGRDGLGEETVEERTGVPARLRRGASHLEQAIDDCSDWEKPATSGIFMLVCDQITLDRYVASGLEDPGDSGVRIEALDSDETPASDSIAVPAVRRNRSGTYLDDWMITAARLTEASVYASCPSGDKVVAARFEDVPIVQGAELTIDDKGPGGSWVLSEADGAPVSEAVPFTTKAKDGLLVPKAPVPGTYLPCRR